ncbi:D-2-hydroxyacid dehydrogenase family protein [Paralcaligenes ginsengisoli]
MNRPLIVVLDDWENGLRRLVDWSAIEQQAEVVIHNRKLSGAALLDALRPAQCVVLMRDRTPINKDMLKLLPTLRHIVFTGTRNKKLDLEAAAERNIQVSHTDWGPSKASTCEMTWTLILAAMKQLPKIMLSSSRLTWRDADSADALPGVLHGQRLGLIGLGQIGQRVAAVGKALGMDVATWSPNMTPERALEHGVTALGLEELLATSAVVSLHLVPAGATHHLLNQERLRLMQPGSLLVNTSRAELIDTPALIEALKEGRPGFAAIDVFDTEPIEPANELLGLPNVLLTPHYGFVSEPVYRKFAEGVRESLRSWLAGGSVLPSSAPV